MDLNPRELFRQANELRKEGRTAEAIALLREPLRRNQLGAEDVDKAGKFLLREFPKSPPGAVRPLRVLLLGQITTTWLCSTLTAVAWGRGVALEVHEGEYDNVFQELASPARKQGDFDAVVLIPWIAKLPDSPQDHATDRAEQALAFWERCWSLVQGSLGARLVQVGYDRPHTGGDGYLSGAQTGGSLGRLRELNLELRERLPSGAAFIDLERVAGEMGRNSFYDARRYYWTKQPLSEAGAMALCEHLWAAIRALATGPKKVLVLDLDNTLWGGIVGEVGPLNIALGESPEGEAFRSFQKYVAQLSRRGVILAVASKNNPEDAIAPFESNPQMILQMQDIAAFKANWNPKEGALREIASELNLGLDSFVFFDDNPAEQEHIRQALPEVEVVDVPADPSQFIQALESGLWFEAARVTDEDRKRARQYRDESDRKALQTGFASLDDYLRSLEMHASVEPVSDVNMQRVVQLLGKTNQFNLTTRRHGEADVRRILDRPRSISLAMSMKDRFGDYGLISLILAVPDDDDADTLRIDTWLMSCRVIGRTAEEFLFGQLAGRGRALGYHTLLGEYIPTKKNALVADLLPRLGFRTMTEQAGTSITYLCDLGSALLPISFIAEETESATLATREAHS